MQLGKRGIGVWLKLDSFCVGFALVTEECHVPNGTAQGHKFVIPVRMSTGLGDVCQPLCATAHGGGICSPLLGAPS